MCTLPCTLSEKANFKFVINPKMDFSGGQKCKKLDFDSKFHFLGGHLGSLITSRHMFRSS